MIGARILTAGLIFSLCLGFRDFFESNPVSHVLIQLPLLAWCGALLAQPAINLEAEWNRGGVVALLIALFGITFWMLPRSIDAALFSPAMEVAKFISLPLCVGAPLAIGWARAHPLLRGFLKAQAVSMLGVMAFLYTHAPVRICNAYLVDDQLRLGYAFLFTAIAVVVLWVAPLFVGSREFHQMRSRSVEAG
ncbi:MAG: hypothetical protein GY877_06605 [Hyphomicrobium sp.]|nr:hypothetical protein [Hyphomicrobium sp.]